MLGSFLDFPLYFRDESHPNYPTNDQQARIIESAARLLIRNGYPVVGIIYSSNYQQTLDIQKAYQAGSYRSGISGLNQAQVMSSMEADLGSDIAADLRLKLRIAPITTISDTPNDLLDIVKADLDRIKSSLDEGWAILGWQNQHTQANASHPYAIGGGVARDLPDAVNELIQERLINFREKYPPVIEKLPSPWPPSPKTVTGHGIISTL
jgi:hypothetical protein